MYNLANFDFIHVILESYHYEILASVLDCQYHNQILYLM